MDNAHNHHTPSQSNFTEYVKFLAVILAVTSLSFLAFILFGQDDGFEFMRLFMGVFLVVFASFKFIGYQMFVMMFQGYDLIARKSKHYAFSYPFIELGLGLMFLADILPVFRNLAVLLIMGIGAVGVFIEIYHRRSGVHCACLGNIIKLPLSTVSLVENVAMVIMASIMLIRM